MSESTEREIIVGFDPKTGEPEYGTSEPVESTSSSQPGLAAVRVRLGGEALGGSDSGVGETQPQVPTEDTPEED